VSEAKVISIAPVTIEEKRRLAIATRKRALADIEQTLGLPAGELDQEHWRTFKVGDHSIFWVEPVTRGHGRSVNVDAFKRSEVSDAGTWGPEPDDPEAEGWLICIRVHDELGNPTGEVSGIWTADYALAVRLARANRASILSEASR
jgi:hypothetical protein